MQKPPKPYDNFKLIFGTLNDAKLDLEEDDSFIIESVFQNGDVQDIRNCRKFYGDDKIVSVLLGSEMLGIKQAHLASAIFDIDIEHFLIYNKQPVKLI